MQNSRKLMLFCAALYLFAVAVLFLFIRRQNGGHFLYALDDPYIHLALAENLAHGHYGINPTEFSSPSSSVLWPFLLIPFAGTALHAYMPLLWNVLFGTISACLIGWVISRWPPQQDERQGMPFWQQMLTGALLILTANLVSLTIVGMEHVLQVMLAIACAIGMIEALSHRAIPRWCLVAAVVAPMVRYEDLTLTLALCFALAGMRRWKTAAVVMALGILPLIGFSLFLAAHGLPVLPMSVLVKGNAYIQAGPLYKVYALLKASIHQDLVNPERFPLVVLLLIVCGLAWQERDRVRRFAFAGASALAALQLTIGRFGWFFRYEVYALIFLVLICLKVLGERPRFLFGYFALGLVFCATPFIEALEQTRTISGEVYDQQYQMHRFVKDFYKGDYAVNDLGLTSFERQPGVYVLDVYGLASVEASKQTDKSAAWLGGIVKRHDIGLAMLYPFWFHIPESWTPEARLCLPIDPLVLAGQCVVFYSTSPASEEVVRKDLQHFGATLPPNLKLEWKFNLDEAGGEQLKADH